MPFPISNWKEEENLQNSIYLFNQFPLLANNTFTGSTYEYGIQSLNNINPTGSFSCEILFNPQHYTPSGSTGAGMIILGIGDNNLQGYSIRISGQLGNLSVSAGNSSSYNSNSPNNAIGVIMAGKWNHIISTYDSSRHNVYINGKLVISTLSLNNPSFPSSSLKLCAGAYQTMISGGNIPVYPFCGEIARVRYWEGKVLSSDEISQLFYNRTSVVNEAKINWEFNKISGSNVIDTSGNNNHGVFPSGTLWEINTNPIPFRRIQRESYWPSTAGALKINDPSYLNFDFSSSFTITGWYYRIGGTQEGIYTKNDTLVNSAATTNTNNVSVWVDTSGRPKCWLMASGSASAMGVRAGSTNANSIMAANGWSHFGYSYNGQPGDGIDAFKYYVNGRSTSMILEYSGPTYNISQSTNQTASIFYNITDGINPGMLKDFMVFDRVISEDEIRSIYRHGKDVDFRKQERYYASGGLNEGYVLQPPLIHLPLSYDTFRSNSLNPSYPGYSFIDPSNTSKRAVAIGGSGGALSDGDDMVENSPYNYGNYFYTPYYFKKGYKEYFPNWYNNGSNGATYDLNGGAFGTSVHRTNLANSYSNTLISDKILSGEFVVSFFTYAPSVSSRNSWLILTTSSFSSSTAITHTNVNNVVSFGWGNSATSIHYQPDIFASGAFNPLQFSVPGTPPINSTLSLMRKRLPDGTGYRYYFYEEPGRGLIHQFDRTGSVALNRATEEEVYLRAQHFEVDLDRYVDDVYVIVETLKPNPEVPSNWVP